AARPVPSATPRRKPALQLPALSLYISARKPDPNLYDSTADLRFSRRPCGTFRRRVGARTACPGLHNRAAVILCAGGAAGDTFGGERLRRQDRGEPQPADGRPVLPPLLRRRRG